jgi:hypothetical protein
MSNTDNWLNAYAQQIALAQAQGIANQSAQGFMTFGNPQPCVGAVQDIDRSKEIDIKKLHTQKLLLLGD